MYFPFLFRYLCISHSSSDIYVFPISLQIFMHFPFLFRYLCITQLPIPFQVSMYFPFLFGYLCISHFSSDIYALPITFQIFLYFPFLFRYVCISHFSSGIYAMRGFPIKYFAASLDGRKIDRRALERLLFRVFPSKELYK